MALCFYRDDSMAIIGDRSMTVQGLMPTGKETHAKDSSSCGRII